MKESIVRNDPFLTHSLQLQKKHEFISKIGKVAFLIREVFSQDNIMTPEEFFALWDAFQNELPVKEENKNEDNTKMSFYHYYLVMNCLENYKKREFEGWPLNV